MHTRSFYDMELMIFTFGYARHPAKSRKGMWSKGENATSIEVGARGFICMNLGARQISGLKVHPILREESTGFYTATNSRMFVLFVRRALWWELRHTRPPRLIYSRTLPSPNPGPYTRAALEEAKIGKK